MAKNSYPNIDMKKTGILLKNKIRQAGYSVKDIQENLMLSCPQPIYRWFDGKVLPSVSHLYALSLLLKVHMEELLVPESDLRKTTEINNRETDSFALMKKRLLLYWEKLARPLKGFHSGKG